MPGLWSSIFAFLLLLGSTGLGFWLHHRLPERHRTRESIEVLHLAISLQATFTAVALGLLVTSVKSGFEAAYLARATYAGELAQLDRCLRDYGEGAGPIRADLRAYVGAVIASTWPDEAPPRGVLVPDVSHMAMTGEDPALADLIDRVGMGVRGLAPTEPLRKAVAAACTADYAAAIQGRWAAVESVHDFVSGPFYAVMVFWLAILFGCLGLRAPPNRLEHGGHRAVRAFGQRRDLRDPGSRPALWRAVRRLQPVHARRARRHDALSGHGALWIGSTQIDLLGRLDRIDVGDVDHHRLVVGAHQHAFQRLRGVGVDLLMRHERRHEDEIAGTRLGDEFQPLAPAHPRAASDDVDHAFELAVVMDAGLGVGGDASPCRPRSSAPRRARG